MRKGLTELVMIMDRSGSMSGLETDTIGGFNSMIEKQKKEDGEAFVSVILFDHETELLYDRVPIHNVEPMTAKQYYVRGSTALLDAVGGAIHHTAMIHRYAREEDRPEKTLFIITTDGMENSSTRYTYADVKRMIEHEKEKYHWEFMFLGANIDAVEESSRFGIHASRAASFHNDDSGIRLNYNTISEIVSCARQAPSAQDMSASFNSKDAFAPIRKDFAKRRR